MVVVSVGLGQKRYGGNVLALDRCSAHIGNSITKNMKQAQGTSITKTQLVRITKTQFLTSFFFDIATVGGTVGQCATT